VRRTGLRLLQLLPVNDTGVYNMWCVVCVRHGGTVTCGGLSVVPVNNTGAYTMWCIGLVPRRPAELVWRGWGLVWCDAAKLGAARSWCKQGLFHGWFGVV